MSLDYYAIESAIAAAVVSGTGLDADQVLWAYEAYQGGERPAGERFVTLQLGPSMSIGIDGFDATTDLTRAVGSEVQLKATTLQQFTLYVSCFGGTPTGNTSAGATMERFRNRLGLPSVRGLLSAVGISPFDSGSVQNVPFIEGTKFESRSVLEMRCYIDVDETDFCGFISRVTGTGELMLDETMTIGTFVFDSNLGA